MNQNIREVLENKEFREVCHAILIISSFSILGFVLGKLMGAIK